MGVYLHFSGPFIRTISASSLAVGPALEEDFFFFGSQVRERARARLGGLELTGARGRKKMAIHTGWVTYGTVCGA